MKLIKKIELDLSHLFLLLAVVFLVIGYFSHDYQSKLWIGFLLIFFYLILQITLHINDKSLTFKTAFEYILIAGLIAIVLLSPLFSNL